MSYDEDSENNFMKQFMNMINETVGQKKKKDEREPMMSYPVPTEHIEKVYELLDVVRTCTREEELCAHNSVWLYIHTFMPAACDYDCRINSSDVLRPVIEFFTPKVKPVAGRDNVIAVYEITGEQYKNYLELTRNQNSILGTYKLYRYVADLHPDIYKLYHKNKCRCVSFAEYAYLIVHEDTDDFLEST